MSGWASSAKMAWSWFDVATTFERSLPRRPPEPNIRKTMGALPRGIVRQLPDCWLLLPSLNPVAQHRRQSSTKLVE